MAKGSKSGIKAGEAFIELGIVSTIEKGLKAAGKQITAFGKTLRNAGAAIGAVGAVAFAPFVAATKIFADAGSEIHDASLRTGIAAEELQFLKYAAEQAGGGLADVEIAVKKMSTTVIDAANGSKTATKSLAALNLTAAELQNLTPDQKLALITQRLNQVEDASTRSSIAVDIFGRSGTGLLAIFAGGAAAAAEMRKQFEALGITMSDEDVKAADDFGDALQDVWLQMKAIAFQTGAAIARALMPFANTLRGALRSVIDFVKQNGKLITLAAALTAGILALGGALTSIGFILIGLGATFSAMAGVVGLFGSALGLLLSPIGLIVAAIAGLVSMIPQVRKAFGDAIGFLVTKFEELSVIAQFAFRGIADALASGDIELAAKILWAGLKVLWLEGIEGLRIAWEDFKNWFIDIASKAFSGVLALWENVQHSLASGWIETVAVLQKAWAKFSSGLKSIWEETQSFLEKRWLELFNLVGALSDEELVAAKTEADRRHNEAMKNIKTEKDAQLDEIEKLRQARVAEAERQHKEALENISAEDQERRDKAKKAHDARVAQIKEEADAARAELAILRSQAGVRRQMLETLFAGRDMVLALMGLKGEGGAGETDAEEISGMLGADKARGLFNVAGLQSLQGAAVKEVDLLGKIERHTKVAADKVGNVPVV